MWVLVQFTETDAIGCQSPALVVGVDWCLWVTSEGRSEDQQYEC